MCVFGMALSFFVGSLTVRNSRGAGESQLQCFSVFTELQGNQPLNSI